MSDLKKGRASMLSYKAFVFGAGGVCLAFMVAPVVVALVLSFTSAQTLQFPPPGLSLQWYKRLIDPVDSGPLHISAWNSAKIAILAVAGAMVVTLPASYGMVRIRSRMASSIEPFLLAPLILPSLVFGIALLITASLLGFRPLLTLVVVSHLVVFGPLMFRIILAPVARDLGIHMNIETHDEITSFEVVRLVETVGTDVVGIVYDMANPLQRGEHPVLTAQRVVPYVRQTHVKDACVAHAEDGLDFQPRACGEGLIDFRTIRPILRAANPGLTLTIENVQSTEDKPRAPSHPRQCIEIYNKAWIDGHPDLSLQEYADYLQEVHLFEMRISNGEAESWETYETRNF